jgi:7-carboxy-7-deazaguanine synthase
LKIYSIFRSLQGEGTTIGTPTTFVRSSGCPLRCTYCDTPQAFDDGNEMSVEEIVEEVKRHGTKNVCVTGGEPMVQKDCVGLLIRLLDSGHRVVLETCGAMPLEELPCTDNMTISMDIKCPSSGESDKMLPENLDLLGPTDQLKFVIADEVDYDFARRTLSGRSLSCEVIFTPVGGKDLRWLAEKVLEDRLDVRVLPQLHKFIWGDEDDR